MSHDDLLEVQRLDTELDRLGFRRNKLEQRQRLAVEVSAQSKVQAEIDVLAAARLKVALKGRRLEDDAATVSSRADADEARLYSGEIRGIKELQALQREIDGLRDRQKSLEDKALDAFEQDEELAGRIVELETIRSLHDSRITDLQLEIKASESEIDAEMQQCRAARSDAVGRINADLMVRYEQLRPRFEPGTVVSFDGSRCVGCPSIMPAVEVDRIKHETSGSVHECGECGRMVLR